MHNNKKDQGEDFSKLIDRIKSDFGASSDKPIDIEDWELYCRVCGYEYDKENLPWRKFGGQWAPSYEI